MRQTKISFENYCCAYHSRDSYALENINLNIFEGETIIITGANGSGKSTLCYSILGLIPHFYSAETKGSIKIDDKETMELSLNKVGYIPQHVENSFVTPYVLTELSFPLEYRDMTLKQIKERIVQIKDKFVLEQLLHKDPQTLSEGQKQIVAIATATIIEPEIIIADEPLSNLDLHNKSKVLKAFTLLKKENKTIIIATNDPSPYLKIADRIIQLKKGRIEKIISKNEFDKFYSILSPQETKYHRNKDNTSQVIDKTIIYELIEVHFTYGKPDFVLFIPSFTIETGEIIGIKGDNGSGKTTLLKILVGLLKPHKGKIFFQGKPLSKIKDDTIARNMSIVFQKPDIQFLADRVEEEVRLTAQQLAITKVYMEIEQLFIKSKLLDHKDCNPHSLSFGEKRKLSFLSAIYHSPKVILLDEITNGLDLDTRMWIEDEIIEMKKQGKAIILTSNDWDWLKSIADRVYYIEKNKETGLSVLKMFKIEGKKDARTDN